MRATQEESADNLLVHWPEEDCVSVVALKNVVELYPPTLHNPCVIQAGKKTFTGVAVQIGSKRRLSELESDFIDGSFEIPVQQSKGKKQEKKMSMNQVQLLRPARSVEPRRVGRSRVLL